MNDPLYYKYHGFDIIESNGIYNACGRDFDEFSSALAFIDRILKAIKSFKSLYKSPTTVVFECGSYEGVLRVLGCLLLRKYFGLVVKYGEFGQPLFFYKW